MKVKELVDYGKKLLEENDINDSQIIARILLESILKISREKIIINADIEVSAKDKDDYEMLIYEVVSGIPSQYITNKQEFYGEEFYVNKNVLIPQPDTEILVEEVINIIKKTNYNRILDICTGSGCIGLSIAKNIDYANVIMTDISEDALEVAKINTTKLDINNVNLVKSDMFEEIEEEFDIIVSNPPYIETDVIETLDKAVQNEPKIALDGGEDGLEFYRELINESHKYLNDDGYLCMEIGYDQKDIIIKLIEQNGNYKNTYNKKDLSGNDRIIICQRR